MKGHYYRLRVEPDHDIEDPCENDGWKIWGFNRRLTNYKDPETIDQDVLAEKLSDGLAFPLDYYKHGLCDWSIASAKHYPDDQWDVSHGAGFIVWEDNPDNLGPKSRADREADAARFLETYTNWCNGNGCGYVLTRDDEDIDVDSCWGYYDLEDLMSAVDGILDEHPDWPIIVEGDLGKAVESYHMAGRNVVSSPEEVENAPDLEYHL